MRALIASSLFVASALVLGGCAVQGVDHEDDEVVSSEVAGALSAYGKSLVGAYQTADMASDFDNIVLKSDGTYFSTETVYCIKAPCEPLRDEGKFIGYKPRSGKYVGGLRLVSKTGKSTYYKVVLGAEGVGFKLSRDGKAWFKYETVPSYCQQASDCGGQSYAHIMCVGSATCTAENRCGWKCGTGTTCDYSDPTKRYIGTSKEACMVMKFFCESGEPFFDDCGCGCTVPAAKPCVVTGCSGQICAEGDMMTTCEWREHYACYKSVGICERGADGTCGWRDTPELEQCIEGTL